MFYITRDWSYIYDTKHAITHGIIMFRSLMRTVIELNQSKTHVRYKQVYVNY